MIAAPPASAIDHSVEVNGLRLHYRESGNLDGPPVLILHGIMGHNREWDILKKALEDRYHVFGLDQRGHGQSEWADAYNVEVMSDDVVALIEQLSLAPVTLIGHSMGGMISMVTAANRPDLVSRIVLIDIGPDSIDSETGDWISQALANFSQQTFDNKEDAVAEWMAGDPYAQEPLMRHYVEHALVEEHGTFKWGFDAAGLLQFMNGGVSPAQLWKAVDQIELPTLLIRGEFSELLTPEAAGEVVRRLGNARVAEIANGAHDLGVQQPEAVAREVRTSLELDA